MSESSRYPADVEPDEVAEAYEATRRRMADLAADLTPEQEAATVPTCPAWTVRDLISHNVGLATELSQGRRSDGDQQQWIDDMVAARRDVSVADQFVEWQESGPAFADVIRARPRLGFLLLDIVAHEHDLAHALGARSGRDSRALEIVMDTTAGDLMSHDLAEHDLGAVALVDVAGARRWVYGTGEVELTLRASMFDLFRLTGSRRSERQLAATDHDGELGRYLPGLLHMPPPIDDIVE